MITPKDIEQFEIESANFEEIEKEIDTEIKNNHGQYPWEEAILDKEYPLSVRNAIAKRYLNGGWKFVYHRTSSENYEKPGLTRFVFSMEPIQHYDDDIFHKLVN